MTGISFELFPPRTPESERRLWPTIDQLHELNPRFVSVTCGGGEAAAAATLRVLSGIITRTGLDCAGHLTCTGRTRAQTDAAVSAYWDAGVRQIVAVRGDMPEIGAAFVPHPDGYRSTTELITAVRRIAPFQITVAAYPEPHPESRSLASDVELLARKADAGASRAITQFCFDTDAIMRLRDRLDQAGVELELIPGIMVTTNFEPVARMARKCGATIPGWLAQRFAGLKDDPETRALLAAIVAADQLQQLRREGFDDFHFYTLNQGGVLPALCRVLEANTATQEAQAA